MTAGPRRTLRADAMTTIRPAVDAAARAAVAPRTEALFRRSGALRDGHFLLKSGRHSDAYLEKFQVLQDPAATSELCGFWAAAHRDAATEARRRPRRRPDHRRRDPRLRDRPPARRPGRSSPRRSGPTTGAIRREFRRGFTIEPGERVLLVDDILTTGGSLLAMIPAVEAAGGEIVDCHVLVDRSGGLRTLTSPRPAGSTRCSALWVLDLPTYEPGPATCPLRRRRAGPRARQDRRGRRRAGDRATRFTAAAVLALVLVLARSWPRCAGAAETPPQAAFTPAPVERRRPVGQAGRLRSAGVAGRRGGPRIDATSLTKSRASRSGPTGQDADVRDRHARERRRVPAGHLRAPGGRRADPRLLPARTASSSPTGSRTPARPTRVPGATSRPA